MYTQGLVTMTIHVNILSIYTQGLVTMTIHVNILSMYTQWPCHYPRKYTINVYTVALSLST